MRAFFDSSAFAKRLVEEPGCLKANPSDFLLTSPFRRNIIPAE